MLILSFFCTGLYLCRGIVALMLFMIKIKRCWQGRICTILCSDVSQSGLYPKFLGICRFRA